MVCHTVVTPRHISSCRRYFSCLSFFQRRAHDFAELIREAGVQTALVSRSTHHGEYHGQCPIPDEAGTICGGKDRFIVWPERQGRRCKGIYFCRRCENGGDALKFAIEILKMPYKEAVQRTNAVPHLLLEHSRRIRSMNRKKLF